MTSKKSLWLSLFLAVIVIVGAAGCMTTTQKKNTAIGTGAGAGIGAALGAAIGALVGDAGTGAALGAIVGAGTGAAVGASVKEGDVEKVKKISGKHMSIQELGDKLLVLGISKEYSDAMMREASEVEREFPDTIFWFNNEGKLRYRITEQRSATSADSADTVDKIAEK